MLLLPLVLLLLLPSTPAGAFEAGSAIARPDEVLQGAYVLPRDGWTDQNRRDSFTAREQIVNTKADIAHEFFSFSKPWDMDRLQWHKDQGRQLLVSWNGTNANRILSGELDDEIRQRARWSKELEDPFLLRFLWEMDAAKGARWGYHEDPTVFTDVWKYVRKIFDEEQVTNAEWVWCPTAWKFNPQNAPAFYPGDDQVDWLCADGYQWSPCINASASNFENVFGAFLKWAEPRKKPIIIAEWGADVGPSQAAFIRGMATGIARHPAIRAVVHFDSRGQGCNWRVESSETSIAAHQDMLANPIFGPGGAVTPPATPPSPTPTPTKPTPTTTPPATQPTAVGYRLVTASGRSIAFGAGQPQMRGAGTPGLSGSGLVGDQLVGVTPQGLVWNLDSAKQQAAPGVAASGDPIVDIGSTASGCLLISDRGQVIASGPGGSLGDTSELTLNAPMVGIDTSASGYWMVASDGGVFSYGDAQFYGSTGGIALNQPIVDLARTSTSKGYWLVASDGGVFSYGDAEFYGSTGAITLNSPIVGMLPTATGRGYWLVAADGGIFAFGDAEFFGSGPGIGLAEQAIGLVPAS